MNYFDKIIHGLRKDMKVPDEVWIKYMDTLYGLPDKSNKASYRFFKKRMWPAAAAAVLAVGTLGVSAAAYLQWSKGLEEGLQTTAEQRQMMEDSQMASFVGQSVTQGDVTVTAQQSIVDNYFAHLSFKVEGYQVEDGVQPGFSGMSIVVGNDEDYTGGWSASFYNGLISGSDGRALHADGTPLANGEKISYTMEDGSMEFQVEMMSEEKGYFINQPIHVELTGLGYYGGKAEDVVVEAEGDWTFDWTLTGSDAVKKYELNMVLEDSGAVVLQAELSPISASITYEFPRQEETELAMDENGREFTHIMYAEPPYFTGVRMKDGTIYTGLSGGGVGDYMSEESDIYECTTALNRVIDVEQVESLLFVKSYPDGEQALTEKNLYFVPVN